MNVRRLAEVPRRTSLLAAGLVVVTIAAVALGVVAGRAVVDDAGPVLGEGGPAAGDGAPRGASPLTAPPSLVGWPPRVERPPVNPPPGYGPFSDAQTGFTIALPRSWQRRLSTDPRVRLVAARDRSAGLLIRAVDLGVRVDASNLPAMKALTDRLVERRPGVEVVAQAQRIELGGLPGYYYLYAFEDGRRRGAHGHYFLFRDETMLSLIFQAPAERFRELSPVFDRIAATFRARV